jgi:hypothetical protein
MDAFIPLHEYFPDLVDKETKIITVLGADKNTPNPGEYAVIESYCGDKNCDCRKAMLAIVPLNPPGEILATIGFGWDTLNFYTAWAGGDHELAKQIKGVYLEFLCDQSQYSGYFLKIISGMVAEETYRSRIIRHYDIFRHRKSAKT